MKQSIELHYNNNTTNNNNKKKKKKKKKVSNENSPSTSGQRIGPGSRRLVGSN